ncbi:MAG: T9SS C-terminal target domain-containing protein [Cytophagia bacterium]|nr:MAG: T9SS C-terminal target domain-containing protein [Cytophagia bacterium]
MKKKCIFFIMMLCIFNTIHAQISVGGMPFSFGSNFKEKHTSLIDVDAIVLNAPNKIKLEEEDTKNSLSRFAAPIPVSFNTQNSGIWTDLFNGDRIWRLKLKAEGAWCLRPLFDKFNLPKGGKMFIYNDEKTKMLGGFTNEAHTQTGRLGTEIIEDDNITIEYYEPKEVKNQATISLFRVDYGYRKKSNNPNKLKSFAAGEQGFNTSGSCNMNVNCPLGADWQSEKRGIVKITLTSINGTDWCSGSMINNTNLDRKQYMLTADHCLDGGGQSFVDTWVYIFNYEAPACVNPTTEPSRSQSVAGGILRSKYSSSDMALIELTTAIPASYNIYFNGWDRNITASTQTVGIHHPDGDIKKISIDQQPAVRVTSYSNNNENSTGSHLLVYWDQNTVTEGGSSGSPLFDQNKRIVGQLHGGASGCGQSASNMWDLYGRVYTSWAGNGTNSTRLSNWLDPTNSGVFVLDGIGLGNPPTITSFTPTSGTIGTSVTITGTNFTGATAVSFNNITATTFNVVSATSITATVPVNATTGTIRVVTAFGTAVSSSNFTFVTPMPPTITSFTPSVSFTTSVVTITGTNFLGASVVSFNNINSTNFVIVNSTTITAVVPAGSTTGQVRVTTPGGTAVSSTNFTLDPSTTLENNNVAQNIKVYPNPAKEYVYIETEKNVDLGKYININLFSVDGKNVEKYTMNLENNENRLKIKTSNLPKGTYFFMLDTSKGNAVKKVVIE